MRLFVVETCSYDEDGESCGCGVFLIKSETEPTCFDEMLKCTPLL